MEKIVKIPDNAGGTLNNFKEVVCKPNASKWNEQNGVWHCVRKGTYVLGPPKNHPEFEAWLSATKELHSKIVIRFNQ